MAENPDIPGYKIVSTLGKGGMATVYLAIQEKLGRKVAIKVLDPSLLVNEEAAVRFEREAKTAAGLSHSNIIQIYDYGKIGKFPYIVMEYLQTALKDLMKQNSEGRIKPDQSLDIIGKLMRSLDYAHFKGVYHRDIKPDNIMFREDSTPLLVDFGIAGLYDATTKLTEIGKPMGTVYYMSPEQCKAQPADGSSDVYSLGVVLFEMLTGKKPYDGNIPVVIALQHIGEQVPKLPGELSHYQLLIDKMMAKKKEKRLSSHPEFLEILDQIRPAPIYPASPLVEFSPPLQEEPPYSKSLKSPRRDFTFKEPTNDLKSVVENYLDLMATKLDSFRKNKLEQFITNLQTKTTQFIKDMKSKMEPRLQSFLKYSLKKKLLIGAFPVAAAILLLIYFLFIHPLSKEPSFITLLIDQASHYYEKNLSLARDLSAKADDLESLKKGLAVTEALMKINPTPELITLEKKFSDGINSLEEEFDRCFNEAKTYFEQKNFSKARESLSRAKKIKITKGLELFEKSIDMYANNPDPVEPLKE